MIFSNCIFLTYDVCGTLGNRSYGNRFLCQFGSLIRSEKWQKHACPTKTSKFLVIQNFKNLNWSRLQIALLSWSSSHSWYHIRKLLSILFCKYTSSITVDTNVCHQVRHCLKYFSFLTSRKKGTSYFHLYVVVFNTASFTHFSAPLTKWVENFHFSHTSDVLIFTVKIAENEEHLTDFDIIDIDLMLPSFNFPLSNSLPYCLESIHNKLGRGFCFYRNDFPTKCLIIETNYSKGSKDLKIGNAGETWISRINDISFSGIQLLLKCLHQTPSCAEMDWFPRISKTTNMKSPIANHRKRFSETPFTSKGFIIRFSNLVIYFHRSMY